MKRDRLRIVYHDNTDKQNKFLQKLVSSEITAEPAEDPARLWHGPVPSSGDSVESDSIPHSLLG